MKTRDEIALEYAKVCESYDKYNSICNTNSHWSTVFKSIDILDFISKSVGFEVTPKLMKKALSMNNTKTAKKSVINPVHDGKDKFNGQVTSKGMDDLVGRYSCDFKNLLISSVGCSTDRVPTKSEIYRVEYDSTGDRYKIYAYEISKDGNEMPNVFTLKDVYDGKKFYHYYENKQEGLATLGVNMVSLYGFPLQKGRSACYDRSKTDALGLHNNGRVMRVVMYDGTNKQLSRFFFENCFLEAFFRVLTNLGYEDDVWDCITGFMNVLQTVSHITLPNGSVIPKEDFIFSRFEIKSANELGNNYWKIVSHRNQEYICYERGVKIKRVASFELIKLVLTYISLKYNYDKNYLLNCVTFYGGHDYTHQGDDTTNYFNTNPNYITSSSSKPVATNNSSPKPVSTASNTHEITDNFVKYSSKSFEKQYKNNYVSRMRFTYKGKDSVILSPRHECKKKKGCFCHADIIYSIIEQLLFNGISIDIIVSHNKYMLKAEHIQDEPRKNDNEAKKDNLQLDLGDGRYYYDSNYTTADSVISSVVALVNDDRLPFELEFEFVSKK